MAISDNELKALIQKSCLCLDDGDWQGYMDLCAEDFTYQITTYSPELRKDMVWLEQDNKGMADLFNNLENHVTLQGRFLRHVNVASIERDNKIVARVVTTVLLMYTDLEGISQIFAAGRYNDSLVTSGIRPLLKTREVRLDTRDLGGGTHFPI